MLLIIHAFLVVYTILLIFSSSVTAIYPQVPCGAVYNPAECINSTWQSLQSVVDFAICAPAKLSPSLRDYIWSGAGQQRTLKENEDAYKRIRIISRVLKDVSRKNLETKVLGKTIQFPIGISPSAGQALVNPAGDIATAKGAWNMGTVMVLSSHSSIALERVAASVPPQANIWMQFYKFPNIRNTMDVIRRAEKAGFKALVLTLDNVAGTRVNCNATEVIFDLLIKQDRLPNVQFPLDSSTNPSLKFTDINWLKRITKLPIIAKGIMTGEDALTALRAGASAVIVSNHGGRQLDGAISTIDALPGVVTAVRQWFPFADIYVDGGIYSGYDVYKAIARGATAAFIGRANVWGLTMGGEEGVKKVLTILKNEFEDAMLHAGFSNVREITINSLIPPYPNFQCGF